MQRTLSYSLYGGLVGLALLSAGAHRPPAPPPPPPQPAPAPQPRDTAKSVIELPLERVVATGGPNQAVPPNFPVRADRGKGVIELPAKKMLAAAAPAPAPKGDAFVNPKVQPGKVKWHADFETACKAAQKSGKPVLLFQMMGKLDDQFC